MTKDFLDNWQTQARKGVLELSVLNALRHGRMYGYEIVKRLQRVQGLVIGEGTIYPIMSRLDREGLVASSLEPSPDGPARKYYRLSPRGRETLERMNDAWDALLRGIEATRSHDDGADGDESDG